MTALVSIAMVTSLIPIGSYADAGNQLAESAGQAITADNGSATANEASDESSATKSAQGNKSASSKAQSEDSATSDSSAQEDSVATSSAPSYIGVEDNDNELANIKDITTKAGKSLKLKVTSGKAKARKAPVRRASGKAGPVDGSSIDSLSIKWITEDTEDDGDASNLYLKPTDNSSQTLTAQIDFSLSGEKNYSAGTVQIKIPGYIFKDRNGKNYGKMVLPLAQAPSTNTDFNWSYVNDDNGGYYILTNTRTMSAASSTSIQFEIQNVYPAQVVDMAKSSNLSADLTVKTTQGNELKASSNAITAQIDTNVRLSSATKRVDSTSVLTKDEMVEKGYTIPSEYAQEEKFLVVDWQLYSYVTGNTYYSLTWQDTAGATMQKGSETVPCKSFFVKNESGTALNNSSSMGSTYRYAYIAYPYSQFEQDITYKMNNTVDWTCKETDNGYTTTKQATSTCTFSYTSGKYAEPQGHFYHEKWGVDSEKNSFNTHYTTSYGNEYNRYGTDGDHTCYGKYYGDLNKLTKDEDCTYCYDQYLRGFFLPWIMKDGEDGKELSDFGAKNVTMSLEDGSLSFRETVDTDPVALEVGKDYDFQKLRLLKPTVWKAVAYDGSDLSSNTVISDNGNTVYVGDENHSNSYGTSTAHGGTYGVGYVRDSNYKDYPDFTVEALVNNQWTQVATVSWKDGAYSKDVALPEGTTKYRVSVTAGKDDDGDGVFVAAVADAFVTPYITLHPTDKVKQIAQSAIENQTNPTSFLINDDSFIASEEGGDTILTMDGKGTDRLYGYVNQTEAHPYKSASTYTDYTNQRMRITYTASMEEFYNGITQTNAWKEGVEEGYIDAEKSCTWYDLLPKGMTPDLSSIKVRSNDKITSKYIIPNYKGSGRTLLVVKVDLTPSPSTTWHGDRYTVYDEPWIQFTATYPFTAIGDFGSTPHNVMAYESGNDHLGTVTNYTGEPDDPTGTTHNNTYTGSSSAFENDAERELMKDLDPDSDNPNFVYAGRTTTLSKLDAVVAELSKTVMVNNDGNWGSGVSEGQVTDNKTVYTGGYYQYRMSATAAAGTKVSDAILYDVIERYTPTSDKVDAGDTTWRGKLVSIDTSPLERAGVKPVVYYYTGDEIDSTAIADSTDDSKQSELAKNLDEAHGWTATAPEDLSTVKAIAIDCSKKADGSDFVLDPGESIAAYLYMRAPESKDAQGYISKADGGTSDDADGAHAYNNVYLYSTSSDAATGTKLASNLVRHDYTKVGIKDYNLTVSKTWSDNDDQDGKRPKSVTIHLYRDGVDTGRSVTLDGTADTAPTQGTIDYEKEAWKGFFKAVDYCDENGRTYSYTFVEDEVPDYTTTVTYSDDQTSATVKNTHKPETVSVKGTKVWDYGSEVDHPKTPSYLYVYLVRDGVRQYSRYVRPDSDGNWSYSFTNLPRYHDHGQEYTYSVTDSLTDYKTSVTTTKDDDGNVTAELKNTYHPYGDLTLTKYVNGVTEAAKDKEFSFTVTFTYNSEERTEPVDYVITDTDGNQVSEGKFTSGGTIKLKANQKVTFKELHKNTQYKIKEDPVPEGFSTSSNPRTGSIYSTTSPRNVSFTNYYNTKGSIRVLANKNLDGANPKDGQFNFTLTDITDSENPKVLRTGINDTDGKVSLGYLRYNASNDGQTYLYKIAETLPEDDNAEKDGIQKGAYTYDPTVYYLKVAVSDNGDGTMTCDQHYYSDEACTQEITSDVLDKGIVFNNSYEATGSATLGAFKVVQGGDLSEGAYSFQLSDEQGNKLYLDANGHTTTAATADDGTQNTPLVAKNTADGSITFPTINYNQDDRAIVDENGKVTYTDKQIVYGVSEIIPDDATAVDSDGNAIASGNATLTYGAASAEQRDTYDFVKDGIKYDKSQIYWGVTLYDNGDGTLSTTSGVVKRDSSGNWKSSKAVPIFTNTGTAHTLSIQKTVTSDSTGYDPDTEFTYQVKIVSDDGTKIPDSAYNYNIYPADETTSDASTTTMSKQSISANSLPHFEDVEQTATLSANANADADKAAVSSDSRTTAKRSSGPKRVTPQTQGKAYAVYDSTTKTLTFIRSNDTVDSGTEGSITDCEGNTYTGTIYTGLGLRTKSWTAWAAPGKEPTCTRDGRRRRSSPSSTPA
ncbi:MAG: Cna B-type domain-containing protein, partial [Coriobacteriales bacterium]